MYDVIVVGSRAAGAVSAMLLARKGLAVLAVDRASFPSDTLSTHQVQVPGVARLARWGLLDQVIAAGTPGARQVRFDTGRVVLQGHFPNLTGVDAVYSPRRTVLDAVLVDAARAAGAEVREDFTVRDLDMVDGRVTGIRGHSRGSQEMVEKAHLVIGADGKHSLVAARLQVPMYHVKPNLTMASYTYFAGVQLTGGEIYGRPGLNVGAWPTNDGHVMTFISRPAAAFTQFRTDIDTHLLAALDQCGDLGDRIRQGTRAERIRTTPDLPNFFRVPHGPGWALVGDAGLTLDPILGHGISDAFRDAELLCDAVEVGLDGRDRLERAFHGYQTERDRRALPMYEFTTDIASFAPPRIEQELLFDALAGDEAQTERFLGVLTGAVPVDEYFTPANLIRLLGLRGLATVILQKIRQHRSPSAQRPDRTEVSA